MLHLGRLAAVLASALVAAACAGPGGSVASPSAANAASATQAATSSPATPVSPSPTPRPIPSPSPSPREVPAFGHVYVIVMENKEYGSIVGSASAPYINSLIARYGLVTDMYAETHPSEPNYIALTSGGLQGTNSDGAYDLDVPNLFDQVEASGRTWHVYAQGYPGDCFRSYGAAAVTDGPGAAGDYARKHNPAISYTSISDNPSRCVRITSLAGFDPGAADFEFIAPNQINDMHSSSVAAGDDFLAAFVPTITGSPAFVNSVLFITWDEGDTSVGGGGHIATIVVAPGLAPGSHFDGPATHYSILRTIELAWDLPLLGEAAAATTIAFGW